MSPIREFTKLAQTAPILMAPPKRQDPTELAEAKLVLRVFWAQAVTRGR